MSEVISIAVDDGAMDIYLDRPDSGAPWPAIVLTYHREGIDDFTKWVARRYAQAGYLVAVPEIAHRIPPSVPPKDRKQHLKDPEIVADIAATVAHLKTRSDVMGDRLAIAGHCMGGHILFVAACALPGFAGAVACYPTGMFEILGRRRDALRSARPVALSGDRLLRQRGPQSLAAGCRPDRCRAHAPAHRAYVPSLPRRRSRLPASHQGRARHPGRPSRFLAKDFCVPGGEAGCSGKDGLAEMVRISPARHAVSVAGIMLACLFAAAPAQAVEAATCRELGRKFDLIKADMVSAQLNSALFAAADGGCEEFAERLLAAGASLEARDRLGAMPLAHAARAGQRALVALLLARGAPIDARDIAGATALYLAAENERPATVALLLQKGADPNLPGRSGVTPLAAAAFKGNDRIVEQLLSRSADPNVVDATGKAAMTYAAARCFVEIVRRLLDAGVDANLRYGNRLTALMWAAGHEDGVGASAAASVIDLLLGRGAAVDAADDRGRTALMTAAERGHAEVVEMLVGRGADQTVRDKSGKTALDLAADERVRRALAAHRSDGSIP